MVRSAASLALTSPQMIEYGCPSIRSVMSSLDHRVKSRNSRSQGESIQKVPTLISHGTQVPNTHTSVQRDGGKSRPIVAPLIDPCGMSKLCLRPSSLLHPRIST